MKNLIVAFLLATASMAASAECSNNYIYSPNGQMTVCQTCCNINGICTTSCWQNQHVTTWHLIQHWMVGLGFERESDVAVTNLFYRGEWE